MKKNRYLKKSIYLIISIIAIQNIGIAQPDIKLDWKADHGFKASLFRYWEDLGTLFVGASDKEISSIDGNGKQLFRIKFQDKFGFKTVESISIHNDEVIELTFKPSKKEPETVILINAKTGNELWRTGSELPKYIELTLDKPKTKVFNNTIPMPSTPAKKIFGSKIRKDINVLIADYGLYQTYRPADDFKWGDEISSSITIPESNVKVTLSYKRKLLRGSVGNNTKLNLTTTKDDNKLWSTDFEAKIVTTLVSDEDMIDFYISQNKIFVIYEGISVFDLNTGKFLWSSEFNNSEVSVGLKAKQELSIADIPLATDDGAYIVDLTSETYGVKKVNLETGKLIWKSPKYSSSDVVPFITIQKNTLLAKFGGIINIQTYIPSSGSTPDVYKSTYKLRGKAGIKAFDTKTGKLLWDEKKLGEKIDFTSDFIQTDGFVSFFSNKSFYTIDVNNGEVKSKIQLSNLSVDNLIAAWSNDDNTKAFAVYDGGIFGVDIATGKALFETKIKDVNGVFKRGDVYFAQIGEDLDKLVAFDLNSGNIYGKLEAKKRNVTEDGNYIIQLDWGKIERYKVK